jgi:hypothetical protein
MNRIFSFALLGALLIVLTGCPIGLDYPLGNSSEQKIDTKLIGKWTIDDPEETILSVSFSKKAENMYLITIHEYSEFFTPETLYFNGWIVSLGGMSFLCTQEIANPDTYYHYVLISVSDNLLNICDMSLLNQGLDAIKSTETLRAEVLESMKKTEFLSGALVYKKVK